VAVIRDDINGFDDIWVFQGRTNAKLCSDFLLVLLLRLTSAPGPKLFDSKYMTTVLVVGFDEAHRTACTGAQNATPFTILLGEMGLSSL
jgi:hypothetical protein